VAFQFYYSTSSKSLFVKSSAYEGMVSCCCCCCGWTASFLTAVASRPLSDEPNKSLSQDRGRIYAVLNCSCGWWACERLDVRFLKTIYTYLSNCYALALSPAQRSVKLSPAPRNGEMATSVRLCVCRQACTVNTKPFNAKFRTMLPICWDRESRLLDAVL